MAGVRGTAHGTVLYSRDKGNTWAQAGAGWSGVAQAIVVHNDYVFASTEPGNIWRLPLSAL